MGRTKHSIINYKNVLAQAFGQFIRRKRNEKKLSFEDALKALDLSKPFLKLLESGGSYFTPVRAHVLTRTFPELQWEPLLKILVATQVLEAGMGDWNELRERISVLKSQDKNLKKFLSNFDEIWDLNPKKQLKEINEIVESEKVYYHLEEYLVHSKNYHLEEPDKTTQDLLDLLRSKPEYFTAIKALIQNLPK